MFRCPVGQIFGPARPGWQADEAELAAGNARDLVTAFSRRRAVSAPSVNQPERRELNRQNPSLHDLAIALRERRSAAQNSCVGAAHNPRNQCVPSAGCDHPGGPS